MNRVAALFMILAVFVFAQSTGGSATAQIGRFQLVSAEYEFGGTTGFVQHKGVFKIDTVTGKTWYYDQGVYKDNQGTNRRVNEWVAINE